MSQTPDILMSGHSSSYEEWRRVAQEAVEQSNRTAPADKQLQFEDFWARIVELGGTDVAALQLLTEDDLIGCGLPKLRARQLLTHLQVKTNEPQSSSSSPRITAQTAPDATDEDLVRDFDPRVPDSPIGRVLSSRSRGKPFIVYDCYDGGGIHRAFTLQVLQEIQNDEPERTELRVRGKTFRLFRVGEAPPRIFDEHPLYRGEALFSDGKCKLGFDWRTGISLVKRAIVSHAVHDTREIRLSDNDRIRELHRLLQVESEEQIRERYPDAASMYDELKAQGNEPSLKVIVERSSTGGGGDPFFRKRPPHRRY